MNLPADPASELARLRRKATIWTWIAVAGVILCACGAGTPPAQIEPSYIKQVAVYQEGDGYAAWFALAAADGGLLHVPGSVTLRFVDRRMDDDGDYYEKALASNRLTVTEDDFAFADVGIGAFAHKMWILPLGRSPHSNFAGQLSRRSFMGRLYVTFTTRSGRTLEGHNDFVWIN